MAIVEARMPDGTIIDLTEVSLTKSGLLIMITDTGGNQTLVHRYAWDGVVKAVHDLFKEREQQAKSRLVDDHGIAD